MARDATKRSQSAALNQMQAHNPTEQRRHLRHDAKIAVRMHRHGKSKGSYFEANMNSLDLSAGGVFIESSFFMKLGLDFDLEFDLPVIDHTVRVRGVIARINDAEHGPSGFGIRFTEFYDKSDVYLRAFLTKGDIFKFVEKFAREELPRVSKANYPKLVEMLIRWQVAQEELPD